MAIAGEMERVRFFEALFKGNDLFEISGPELLSLATKFNKIEHTYCEMYNNHFLYKKIAVLGSYTTHYFINVLKLFLYKYGISPAFYEAEYNSVNSEILNKTSGLYKYRPNYLLLMLHDTDIKEYPPLFSNNEVVSNWVERNLEHYKNLWEHVKKIEGCQIFQTNFAINTHRQLGNLESNYLFSKTNCMRALNYILVKEKPPYVTFIDMEYLSGYYGKSNWFDMKNYFFSKQGMSFEAFGLMAYNIARIMSSVSGMSRKCLVLDLDNTLWGGVIGDDGLDGINLNPSDPEGEAFIYFQLYIKKLKERGVILTVCSKNDVANAKLPFQEHPDIVLKLDDFSCFIANWDDKSNNINKIASKLNIGLDSMVFFDDNPAERELVKLFTPEVEVIEVPGDPALYVDILERSMAFEWGAITEEDIVRTASYIADNKRSELANQAIDYNTYLKNLDMKAKVDVMGNLELVRFTQLINKSNQFNLRTKRYTEAAIMDMKNKGEFIPIYISLEDKFSNYGIISCIIIKQETRIAFIDTWVMSCRVLNRGVEEVAINAMVNTARLLNCEWLVGEYIPTKKNGLVKDIYSNYEFEATDPCWYSPSEDGAIVYRLKLSNVILNEHFINIDRGLYD